MTKQNIFITGGAGYVGVMLLDVFARRENIEKIIYLDKVAMSENDSKLIEAHPNKDKFIFIEENLCENTWPEKVKYFEPSVVIHTAWQIREIYGDRPLSWKWNIDGSNNLFDFCFSNNFVKRLVYFSTVASYGAFVDNSLDYRFVESDLFRKTNYLYAEEKRIVEQNLENKYKEYKEKQAALNNAENICVSILRPAAITGPRGRYERIRFGLQSALSGSINGGFYTLVRTMTKVVPATKKWVRQYIHEDDVVGIVSLLAFDEKVKHGYEVFNICPPGAAVLAPDMAKAVNKKMIIVPTLLVRMGFFTLWHLSKGKVPTAEGSWKGYSYPIVVDGSKITRMYNYIYGVESKKAFVENEGRYKVQS